MRKTLPHRLQRPQTRLPGQSRADLHAAGPLPADPRPGLCHRALLRRVHRSGISHIPVMIVNQDGKQLGNALVDVFQSEDLADLVEPTSIRRPGRRPQTGGR